MTPYAHEGKERKGTMENRFIESFCTLFGQKVYSGGKLLLGETEADKVMDFIRSELSLHTEAVREMIRGMKRSGKHSLSEAPEDDGRCFYCYERPANKNSLCISKSQENYNRTVDDILFHLDDLTKK